MGGGVSVQVEACVSATIVSIDLKYVELEITEGFNEFYSFISPSAYMFRTVTLVIISYISPIISKILLYSPIHFTIFSYILLYFTQISPILDPRL